jgi:hypothetical protein
MLNYDNCSLFTALNMIEQELTFEELCSLLESSGFLRKGEDVKDHVSLSLDTLLDFSIFRAEWKKDDNTFRRRFVNRNELLNIFSEFKGKLMQKLKDTNFAQDARKLRSLIHLQEAYDLTDKERFFYSKRIEEVETDFIRFLKYHVLKPEYEILHPLARKAWAIFEHLREKHSDEIEWKIPIEYNIFSEKLKNKKICIFDDAVDEGKRLHKALKDLLDAGINPQNVAVAAYIVNEKYFDLDNAYRKEINDILHGEIAYYQCLKDVEFHKKVADILMYIASFGSIIDPDHLVVKIKLAEHVKCRDIMKIFKDLGIGKTLEPGVNLQYLHPGKKKITLDAIDYCLVTREQMLPESVREISQCKIRTIWEYDDKEFVTYTATLTPIINPVIVDKVAMRSKCEKSPSVKFCELIEEYPLLRKYNLCADCTLFHMITKLLREFLIIFSEKMPSNFIVQEITWVEFESKYGDVPSLKQEFENFKQEIRGRHRS